MKKTTKYIIAGLVTAVGLLCVIIAGATSSGSHDCDAICKYATEAVEVLEKYKGAKISEEEVTKRINKLIDLINKEEKKTTSGEDDNHRLLMLRMALVPARMKLEVAGYMTYYEVSEAIDEIKANL